MAAYSQTLLTLRATIRDFLNQPAGSKNISDTQIDRFLNIAQQEICKYSEALTKTENPAIVASTAAYSLPDDWLSTKSVQYQVDPTSSAEYQVLIPISRDEYLNLRTITTSSRPTHYTIYDGNLYIYPTPTGTTDEYYHTYAAQAAELSLTTDVPFNSEKRFYPYHQLLVDLAVNYIRTRDRAQPSQSAIAAFLPMIEVMKRKLGNSTKPPGRQVKRRFAKGGYRPPWPTLPSNY
jgi:hypothetical protein